ncbi:MAG TPA: hypothetical protein VNW04_12875 [Puia sp.]|jgi:hypothetical protein|nr:hypothetical protein [Puia sp.]
MPLDDTMTLTIQGRAEAAILEKLSKEYELNESQRWLFVDYSPQKISLESQFDVLLEGDSKSLVPGIFVVKVLECLDQFGNNLSDIPEGFKTICKLEFFPEVPHKIDTLPSLHTWKHNPNKITLTNHKTINLAISSSYVDDLSRIAYFLILDYRNSANSDIITKSEFYTYLETKFQVNSKHAADILTVFIQLGKIKPINNNHIELLAAV